MTEDDDSKAVEARSGAPEINIKMTPSSRAALNDLAQSWTKTVNLSQAFSAEALRIQEIFKGIALKIQVPGFEPLTKPLLPDLSKVIPDLSKLIVLPRFDRVLESFKPAFEGLLESWERSLPPNWRGVNARRVGEIVEIMARTGLALAWVPRGEIVEQVIRAQSDSERFEILVLREADVLDDIGSCFAEVASSDLKEIRLAAEEALSAFRDGHTRAAQALAAASLTHGIEETLGVRLGEMRKRFASEDPNQASIRRFRLVATFVVIARDTLSQFDRKRGDEIPGRFNRHASLHTVSSIQYTRRNAVMSLMLLASVLRELESRS